LSEVYDKESFGLRLSNSDEMTLGDNSNARIDIHGTGFEYSNGKATAGIITSATFYDDSGHTLLTVEDAHIKASRLFAEMNKYGVNYLPWTLASHNDEVYGSNASDNITGGTGDDVIRGGAGGDYLNGYFGNDTLYGGKGADQFLFGTGWGIDTIKDFHDSGSDQDIIHLQYQSMWNSMVKHQEGDNVVLDFGHGDKLIIEHAQAANITMDDFQFG